MFDEDEFVGYLITENEDGNRGERPAGQVSGYGASNASDASGAGTNSGSGREGGGQGSSRGGGNGAGHGASGGHSRRGCFNWILAVWAILLFLSLRVMLGIY